MITAIIPIPMRYPHGHLLGSGFLVNEKIGISGRAVRALPLYFYKFFSSYGNSCYQHIFATDTILDTARLSTCKNIFNSQISDTGGTLVPISVKRLDTGGTNTFLFTKCINFLLRNYHCGVPLDEVDVLGLTANSELAPLCCGVSGISEFNFWHMKDFMERHNWCGLDAHSRRLMSVLTPETPAHTSNYVSEIVEGQWHEDAMAEYITDMCTYEMGIAMSMKDFLEAEKYTYPIDPITAACINTPSYLYGATLRPYLGDPNTMRGYSMLASQPLDNAFTRAALNLSFENADPYTWSDEFMEDLVNMGDDEFTLTVTSAGPVMQGYDVVTSRAPSITEHLYKSLLCSFSKYDRVELIKTWAEEVFLTFWKGSTSHTFYINLAWYHLITPSLINMNLVTG